MKFKEKIKNLNWKLIFSVLVLLFYLCGYFGVGITLMHPDFAPMLVDDYVITNDVLFGFLVASGFYFFMNFLFVLCDVFDIFFSKKQRTASE